MKERLVAHVEPDVMKAIQKMADKESRTLSQMAAVLVAEALAAREKKAKAAA